MSQNGLSQWLEPKGLRRAGHFGPFHGSNRRRSGKQMITLDLNHFGFCGRGGQRGGEDEEKKEAKVKRKEGILAPGPTSMAVYPTCSHLMSSLPSIQTVWFGKAAIAEWPLSKSRLLCLSQSSLESNGFISTQSPLVEGKAAIAERPPFPSQ